MSAIRSRTLRYRVLIPLVLVVLVAGYPTVDGSTFGMGRLELALVYAMAALSLNLAFGYGGQLAVGQAAMLTAAGYTAGIISVRHDWSLWETTPLAVVAAIIVSVFMGLPSLRVSGWYLGVVGVLGVALVPDLVTAFGSLTGGTDGLPGIRPVDFGDTLLPNWAVYELMLAATVLCTIALRNLVRSGWGMTLIAYRDHPVAAVASGVNTMRLRALVYVLAGVPCGIAGALYAHSQQFISASNFTTQTVLLLIGSVFLGGPGTISGPFIGVAIFQGISLWFGPFSQWNPLVLGLGVLLAALVFPGGIVRVVSREWRRLRRRRGGAARTTARHVDMEHTIAPVDRRPQLAAAGITKRFAGNLALADVGFQARGGEVLTVVGPNGSGKTTLLNCVSGFVTPESGTIDLDERDLVTTPAHRRAHAGIARTFQVPRLVEGTSIRENVELGVYGLSAQSIAGALFRLPGFRRQRREAARRAIDACHALGFTDVEIASDVAELPLGLKRLVEIARALAANASVICLDEPVAGLNDAERERVHTVLRALAASGRCVLLIEHNLPFVHSVSDRLVLLRDGKVADTGTPSDTHDVSRPLGAYFKTFVTKQDAEITDADTTGASDTYTTTANPNAAR